MVPTLFPKLDFKILVSPYTFGLSQMVLDPIDAEADDFDEGSESD